MRAPKRQLLTDSVALFARYLQHEYLTNGLVNLKDQHIFYDRWAVTLQVENKRGDRLNQNLVEQYFERVFYICPVDSKVILLFLEGQLSFYSFYDAMISYLLEVEQSTYMLDTQVTDAETRLEVLTSSTQPTSNVMIVQGRERTDCMLQHREMTLTDLENRQFIYPYNLTAKDVMNLIAYEEPKVTLIHTLTRQAPDSIISIYDYYMWIKKECTRRGILIQKVGQRLSVYDNTHLNFDLPASLECLVEIDKRNRGKGFEHLTYEEHQRFQGRINDLYMIGLETQTRKQGLPFLHSSTFAVSLFDCGFGQTLLQTENNDAKLLKETTIEDLKCHIKKVLVQQQGVTSITFKSERYEPSRLLRNIRPKRFLLEVEAHLDETILNKISY